MGRTSLPRLIILAGILWVMVVGCVDQSQIATSSIPSPALPSDTVPPDQVNTTVPPGPSAIETTPEILLEATREDFPEESIIGVLAADGRFETFLSLLEEYSPLQLRLIASPTFNHSLLAPTDDAFAALDPESLHEMLDDETETRDLFHRHVINGSPKTAEDLMADVRSSDGFVSVIANAGLLRFSIVDDSVLHVVLCEVSGSECRPLPGMAAVAIVESDIEASNGLIHVIDGVLTPPEK